MKLVGVMFVALLLGARVAGAAATAPATTQSSLVTTAPTRVTLKLDRVPAPDALARLFGAAKLDATGVLTPAFVEANADVTVTADFVDEPFIMALLTICRQAWLEPGNPRPNGRLMAIGSRRASRPPAMRGAAAVTRPATRGATTMTTAAARRPAPFRRPEGPVFRPLGSPLGDRASTTRPATLPSWVDGPATASGPFVFVALQARRTSQVDLDRPEQSRRDLQVSLLALPDPRTRVYAMAQVMEVEEATDEAGRSLLPPPAPPRTRGPGSTAPHPQPTGAPQRFVWSFNAPLAYPPDDSRTLARLRGRVNVSLVRRSERIDLIHGGIAALNGEHVVGPWRIQVGPFVAGGNGSRLRVTVVPTGGAPQPAWDEWQTLARGDTFEATGANGERYYTRTTCEGIGGNVQVMADFHPVVMPPDAPPAGPVPGNRPPPPLPNVPPAKPVNVVWHLASEVEETSIPVEFTNLPLP